MQQCVASLLNYIFYSHSSTRIARAAPTPAPAPAPEFSIYARGIPTPHHAHSFAFRTLLATFHYTSVAELIAHT